MRVKGETLLGFAMAIIADWDSRPRVGLRVACVVTSGAGL